MVKPAQMFQFPTVGYIVKGRRQSVNLGRLQDVSGMDIRVALMRDGSLRGVFRRRFVSLSRLLGLVLVASRRRNEDF
jgi:hypothetical protein